MTDTLTGAETRAQTAQTAWQAFEAAILDATRADIRRTSPRDGFSDLYEEGRRQLPIVEQGLADAGAWMQRLRKIAHTSRASLAIFQGILDTINQHCATGGHELRRGLAAYEQLRFADIARATDSRQVDETKRLSLIGSIRRDLRSWDGRLSFVTTQRARVDEAIAQGGWPQGSGAPVPTVTVENPEQRPRPAGIRVEIGGGPRPPV